MSTAYEFAVVIPAYNAVGTLERSVASAFESGASRVIVVDDGSTDGTAESARKLGCVVVVQENAGAARARRVGISMLTEEYAVLLDSDDSLVREGIRHSLRTLAADRELVAVQGLTIGIGASGKRRLIHQSPDGVTLAGLLLRGHAPGPPAAFMWRTSVLESVIAPTPPGVWPRYAEDYEFLLRGVLVGPIGVHHEVSCLYQWTGGKSGANPAKSILDADRIRLHYGQMVGVDVNPRSSREVRSMVFLRRASALTSIATRPRWITYIALAIAADPRGFVLRIARRMGRNNENK
jgi:glycosyltransferase involved in cell wall biosynthesis